MKKLFFAVIALLSVVSMQAVDLFNHLGVGVGVGTTGVSIDVAMPVTKFLTIRPGFNYFPNISYSTDIDIYNSYEAAGFNIPSSIEIEGKTGLTTGKVLLDFYPIPVSGFHITAGAYFGKSEVIEVNNKEDGALKGITDWNAAHPTEQIGAELGEYLLTPDARGNVHGAIKTKSFRPYVGLGFGRAIPGHFMNFQLELGCQFWGSPKIYCNDVELTKNDNIDGDGGFTKIVSKISVFPVLNLRLGFRAF